MSVCALILVQVSTRIWMHADSVKAYWINLSMHMAIRSDITSRWILHLPNPQIDETEKQSRAKIVCWRTGTGRWFWVSRMVLQSHFFGNVFQSFASWNWISWSYLQMSVHMEERNNSQSALFSCRCCLDITTSFGVFYLHVMGSTVWFLLEHLSDTTVLVIHRKRLLKPLK